MLCQRRRPSSSTTQSPSIRVFLPPRHGRRQCRSNGHLSSQLLKLASRLPEPCAVEANHRCSVYFWAFYGLFQVMQAISSTKKTVGLFKSADSMLTQGFHHSKICHGWTAVIQQTWRTSKATSRRSKVPVVPVQTAHLAEIAAFLRFALQPSSTVRSKNLKR